MTTTHGDLVTTLKLRQDKLTALRRIAHLDTDAAFARELGFDKGTVCRIFNGRSAMSTRFIAEVCRVFGADLFQDIFEVIPDPGDQSHPIYPSGPSRAGAAGSSP